MRSFACELTIMGKVYKDDGVLYRMDGTQTYMRTGAPVMAMNASPITSGDGRIDAADGQVFSLRGFSAGNTTGTNQETRASLNGLAYAQASLASGVLTTTIIDPGAGLASNRFGVLLIGTQEDVEGLFKPFTAYARLLVYKA